MYLESGLTPTQLKNYLEYLRNEAVEQSKVLQILPEDTPIAKAFKGYDLKGNKVTLELFSMDLTLVVPELARQTKGSKKENVIKFILDFIFDVPIEKETFYSSQITNNAQFMATRFKHLQGFSGTAQRKYQYWESTEYIPDKGSSMAVETKILGQLEIVYELQNEEAVLEFMMANKQPTVIFTDETNLVEYSTNLSKANPRIEHVCIGEQRPNCDVTIVNKLEENVPAILVDGTIDDEAEALFNATLYCSYQRNISLKMDVKVHTGEGLSAFEALCRFKEPVRALIDLGAFLRSTKNEVVARNILEGSVPEIETVLFYDDENYLSFVKKSWTSEKKGFTIDAPARVFSEKLQDMKNQIGGDLINWFVYYDQKHIIGTDLKFMDGAIAYVTVGPTTTRTDLEQAVMRMRGLLSGKHKLRFVISSDVAMSILSREMSHVSLLGIIKHCIYNETQIFKSDDKTGEINRQNMLLLYQKVRAQYMDVAFTHLVKMVAENKPERTEEAVEMFKVVREWFIEKSDEFKPLEQSSYEDTLSVLEAHNLKLYNTIHDSPLWTAVYTEVELVKPRVSEIIKTFCDDELVEPKTPTPSFRSLQNATEVQVQNENQNQAQNQNRNQNRNIGDSLHPVKEWPWDNGRCLQYPPAFFGFESILGDENMNIFEDRFIISENVLRTARSLNGPIAKIPAYFLRKDKVIYAITHAEAESIKERDQIFYLINEHPLTLSGMNFEVDEQQVISLLVFYGDFETLSKANMENAVKKWISDRCILGTGLLDVLSAYFERTTKLGKACRFMKIAESAIEECIVDYKSEFLVKNPFFKLIAFFKTPHYPSMFSEKTWKRFYGLSSFLAKRCTRNPAFKLFMKRIAETRPLSPSEFGFMIANLDVLAVFYEVPQEFINVTDDGMIFLLNCRYIQKGYELDKIVTQFNGFNAELIKMLLLKGPAEKIKKGLESDQHSYLLNWPPLLEALTHVDDIKFPQLELLMMFNFSHSQKVQLLGSLFKWYPDKQNLLDTIDFPALYYNEVSKNVLIEELLQASNSALASPFDRSRTIKYLIKHRITDIDYFKESNCLELLVGNKLINDEFLYKMMTEDGVADMNRKRAIHYSEPNIHYKTKILELYPLLPEDKRSFLRPYVLYTIDHAEEYETFASNSEESEQFKSTLCNLKREFPESVEVKFLDLLKTKILLEEFDDLIGWIKKNRSSISEDPKDILGILTECFNRLSREEESCLMPSLWDLMSAIHLQFNADDAIEAICSVKMCTRQKVLEHRRVHLVLLGLKNFLKLSGDDPTSLASALRYLKPHIRFNGNFEISGGHLSFNDFKESILFNPNVFVGKNHRAAVSLTVLYDKIYPWLDQNELKHNKGYQEIIWALLREIE